MPRTIRRRAGRRAALAAVGAMTAGLLLTAPQQATAGAPNLLTNPGFETAGAPGSDMPSCWEKSGWATTTSPSPPSPTPTAAPRP